MRIYKVCPAAEWKDAQAKGVYSGTKMDRGFGRIHLCTEEQISEVVQRTQAPLNDLIVLEIASEKLQGLVRFEKTRAGSVYPHLYAPLPVETVVRAAALTRKADGTIALAS